MWINAELHSRGGGNGRQSLQTAAIDLHVDAVALTCQCII